MADSRALGLIAPDNRYKDVLEAILFMTNVTLLFENAEHGTNGGVAGSVRHRVSNFQGSRFTLLIQNVHDLPFTPAEQASTL